jgi:hypothetical protein
MSPIGTKLDMPMQSPHVRCEVVDAGREMARWASTRQARKRRLR